MRLVFHDECHPMVLTNQYVCDLVGPLADSRRYIVTCVVTNVKSNYVNDLLVPDCLHRWFSGE